MELCNVPPEQVRAWAIERGLPVSTRGRVPRAICELYLAANKAAA